MAAEIAIEVQRQGKGPIRRLNRADVVGIIELLLAEVLEGISRGVAITGEPFGASVSLVRTGALIRSAQVVAKSGKSGELRFTAPYARFLQRGTRHMPARPFAGYTIESARLVTRQVAKVVQRKILRKKGTSAALKNAAGGLALSAEGDTLALDSGSGGLAI